MTSITDAYPKQDEFSPHAILVISILIVSTRLYQGLPNGLFPLYFPNKILCPVDTKLCTDLNQLLYLYFSILSPQKKGNHLMMAHVAETCQKLEQTYD